MAQAPFSHYASKVPPPLSLLRKDIGGGGTYWGVALEWEKGACDYGSELIMVNIIYLVNIMIYMRCDHYNYTHCIAHNHSKIPNTI